ncbi:MAG: MarR family transcriptional regulator [Coriobacteriia bacterium]|nr:MarR family transcriptional regulator [Coriobacteriia bacterium]
MNPDDFGEQLNELIVCTFHSILRVEERALKESGSVDLSMSEMHLIEAVSLLQHAKATVSDLAAYLQVTLPSVTVAVNKLQAKGYLAKVRATSDARKVYVALTDLGEAVNEYHTLFHRRMVNAISRNFTPQEKGVLLQGVIKLNEFFSSLSEDARAYEL